MDAEDQRAYLAHREQQEITKAAACEDNAVARAHLEMASLYRERIEAMKSPSPGVDAGRFAPPLTGKADGRPLGELRDG